VLRKRQGCYAGPAAGAAEYLKAYVSAGANHIIVRFTGEPEDQFAAFSRVRAQLG